MLGKLLESSIGSLPLTGFHEFEIFKNTNLNFIFKSLKTTQTKSISLHCFEDSSIFREKEVEVPIKSIKKKSIVKNFLYLVKKLLTKLFN